MNQQVADLLAGILDGTEPGFEATFPTDRASNAFYAVDPLKSRNWIDVIANLTTDLLSGCIQDDDRQDSSYATVKAWCVAAFADLVDFEMSAIAEGQPINLNTEN